ncbi:hypothetical protein [Lacipirellula parvula]|nr:hypothetical protein [Lacipirellula parvula]
MATFDIRRPVVAIVPMQHVSTHLARFVAAICWLMLCCALPAAAEESKTVDPFLQAAQWAEEVPANEEFSDDSNADPALECTDAVDCGDEIGLAALIEPNRLQCRRWAVLVDFPILLPYLDSRVVTTPKENPVFGPRLSLAWQNANGLGVQARGWGFDNAVDVEGSPLMTQNFSYYYYPTNLTENKLIFRGGKFDLDFYKHMEFEGGYLRVGASLTAAQLTVRNEYAYQYTTYSYNYNYIIDDYTGYSYYNPTYTQNVVTVEDADKIRTRGGGLGLLLEGSHRINNSPTHQWSVFGSGRFAYLVGEQQADASYWRTGRDASFTVGEAAVGLEYRRKLPRADLFVRCAFEIQTWDVPQIQRVSLAGVTPSVGISW